MKIAVSMWSLHKEALAGRLSIVDFINWAAKSGAEGVELLDFFWQDYETEISPVQEALAKINMPVAAYAVGNNFAQVDPKERKKQLDIVLHGIDTAVKLQTKIVRVFSGDLSEGISHEQALAWIIDCLQEAAQYAKEKGILLCLENHGLLAGKSTQVKEILDRVNSSALRATIDTGNFLLVDEEPVEAVQNLAALAGHVHFKDFRAARNEEEQQAFHSLAGKKYIGTVAGEGGVDLTQVLLELQKATYGGWLSVEFEGLGDEYQGTLKSIDNLKTTLSKLPKIK